jgi:hypothetical protein
MTSLLQLDRISVAYGATAVLRDVSLEVNKGKSFRLSRADYRANPLRRAGHHATGNPFGGAPWTFSRA